MDINASKNLAFAIFTVAPVILAAVLIVLVMLVFTGLNKKKVNYKFISKSCLKAILYQIGFLLLTVGIGYVLFLLGTMKFIPLIILLPISTIISIASFGVLLIKNRGEVFV